MPSKFYVPRQSGFMVVIIISKRSFTGWSIRCGCNEYLADSLDVYALSWAYASAGD